MSKQEEPAIAWRGFSAVKVDKAQCFLVQRKKRNGRFRREDWFLYTRILQAGVTVCPGNMWAYIMELVVVMDLSYAGNRVTTVATRVRGRCRGSTCTWFPTSQLT